MPTAIGSVMWSSPVGVGAGLIKNGETLIELNRHADAIEVGSITRNLRTGNEGKVVWKYPKEKTIRHNAGLPNMGAVHAVEELKEAQFKINVPWGLNIAVSPGMNSIDEAVKDISETAGILFKGGLKPHWLTLNVSSPDSSDKVEMLSEPVRVARLIVALRPFLDKTPLWLKMGVGLGREQTRLLAYVSIDYGVEAIICSNAMADPNGGVGGWCGTPLYAHSRATVWQIKQLVKDKIAVVGVGGIQTGEQVAEMLKMGASAVQVVSALLFMGHDAAKTIKQEYEMAIAMDAGSGPA